MDATERALFEGSVRRALELHRGAALDAALDELGWGEALAHDPRTAVSVLFGLQGAAHAASPALEHVLASALGLAGDAAIVLPPLDRWHPPGDLTGGTLVVDGLCTAGLAAHDSVLVVGRDGDHDVVVEVAVADLTLRSVHGVDPDLGLIEVAGDGVTSGPPVAIDPDGWRSAVALSQLALAHELVGASRRMLELAREHALGRVQFGRPISAFQAVRHRLAETLIAIETAEAMVTAAWADRSPESAQMAKALAGRGAATAARHCQQVLAGIGFTTDHELHHHIRRVLVLDQLFGTARTLTRDLGRELLRTRQLMALPPL
jgi:hypothetical protein